MKIRNIFAIAALSLGFGSLPTASSTAPNTSVVLQMYGEGTEVGNLADVSARLGVELTEQDVGFALTSFACHEMDVIDPGSKLKLGRGIDCLANITPDENGGLTLTGVSIFMLPGGTIISKGETSLQTFINGFGSGEGSRSHITGGFPTVDNVIATTGDFVDMTGKARLSGMVRAGGEKMMFDCLFVIDLTHS
ncbi:hypothetical protein O2N63_16845 [Aliiroseovarius sp. KMU-50]|uniref:DUF4402 domain-containing protein n=1 Tax=Aliiroseovarius salicola TaxID=3009082 RepID=A0ABT4W5G8_9RHOB|nr:hypothetical protein [Aliiroseovarius sp. KMU-50]MDA5095760.1 hypothetical protein [Aliiroseovarius sp. KMU-50]